MSDRVEQPVAAETYTAPTLAVAYQGGAEVSGSYMQNTADFALPSVQLVDTQAQASSDVQRIGPSLGGRTHELSPPGAPFSLQLIAPDRAGTEPLPNLAGDRTLPRLPNASGDQTTPNADTAPADPTLPNMETAPGDPTVPNMVPNAERTLPNAEPNIDFDALGDNNEIRSHMTPGKPGDAKPFGKEPSLEGAAREIGAKLQEAAKQERIREFFRNHIRRQLKS